MIVDLEALSASSKPLLMGILNVTPDSFSDGGQFHAVAQAIEHGQSLTEAGALIIDIGGESTAPGSIPVDAAQELARVITPITELSKIASVSIDTYKAEVADQALRAGACMVNDVSGLRADPRMAQTIAQHKAFVIIMHSKETAAHPHASDSKRSYEDVVAQVSDFLLERAHFAEKAGIDSKKIFLDPGMGRFLSHDATYSWELLRRFEELVSKLKPYPVVVATSRKGFLGGPLQMRDPVSQLTALHAVRAGAKLVRTHNVAMMHRFLEAETSIKG